MNRLGTLGAIASFTGYDGSTHGGQDLACKNSEQAMNAHLVTIYDKPPTSRTRLAWWRFVERQLPMLVIYLLVATLVGVILAPFCLITVPSGYVGVLWKRFGGGTVLNPSLLKNEGMRITSAVELSIFV